MEMHELIRACIKVIRAHDGDIYTDAPEYADQVVECYDALTELQDVLRKGGH